ncbi:putative glycoside hydrolase [Lapillicoccus jejuensis]|uniref:putative glycoside hydrolase n=1 Tax=Lapillicoccus jejuensis TaxID=402171 RepID=UPI00147773B7|nr:putative glycoside hydrolase [Lapillicoccus jejuensis]
MGALVALLLAGLTGLTVGPPGAAAAPTAPTATGSVFATWAPQYMTRESSVTLDQALADARTDLLVAKPGIYTPYLPQMRALNPALRILTYLNATEANHALGTAYPADWYVRGADGTKVRSKYGAWMMDPRKAGWVRTRATECRDRTAESGYDGCLFDIMGPGPVIGPFGPGMASDREPIDARTGLPWTPTDWIAATTALGATVRAKVAPLPVYGNSVGDGDRYFGVDGTGATATLLDGTDGMISETFLRAGRAPLDPPPTLDQWRLSVAMVADAEAKGHVLLLCTKVWTDAPVAAKDQWHEFSMGTYLLAAQGLTRWTFLYDITERSTTVRPQWAAAAQLGTPTGAYTVNGKGVYQRVFTGGKVLVNPGTRTLTVSLGRPFVDLSGASVTSVTLPPHSAKVLRRA